MFNFLRKDKEVKENIYIWKGVDKKGKDVSGEMRASSETLVRVSLRTRGISISKIKKQAFHRGKKIKQRDVAVFTRQLATMLKAGVPILQSFDIVANGNTNPSVKKLLLDIKSKVESGSSLATAFSAHPKHFDKLYCNLIAAGETAGILDSVLERLATYQEKIAALRSKIKKALMYPIGVIAVSLIVTSIIMIFVIPAFKELFESFGAELPGPTQLVIYLSDIFVNNWYWVLGSIVLFLVTLIKSYKGVTSVRNIIDRFLLKIPVIGRVLNKSAVARWCRTLGTMFSAGVPLVEALGSVGNASGNAVYSEATKEIQKQIATGQSLTRAIQEQALFPNMMIQMAQIGEESGSLDQMLGKVADIYETEVDDTVSSMASLIEPFIIVFLGVVIGGLVLAMYLPIFKMASAV